MKIHHYLHTLVPLETLDTGLTGDQFLGVLKMYLLHALNPSLTVRLYHEWKHL